MCEPTDWLANLQGVWLNVAAFADSLEGDKRRLATCVAKSVRHDIEAAVRQWRAERQGGE
jgi:hypothetical protein